MPLGLDLSLMASCRSNEQLQSLFCSPVKYACFYAYVPGSQLAHYGFEAANRSDMSFPFLSSASSFYGFNCDLGFSLKCTMLLVVTSSFAFSPCMASRTREQLLSTELWSSYTDD